MHRALLGWTLIAGCLVLLGAGTVIGVRSLRGYEVPAATVTQWRQYAADVERGARTSSPALTRLLTEAAITQNRYASAAVDLVRFVGGGVFILGLLLGLDLWRYRMKHPERAPPPE
ncbi:MAG: hypothetical protein ACJ8DC_10270 [Gemmatimonadales bacterium]